MKKLLLGLLTLCMIISLAGCTNKESATENNESETVVETKDKKFLVVYFSRAGEQYSVGVVEKGNTSIVAEMIAENTNADLFEIVPADDHYSVTYEELTEIAKNEQAENARIQYQGNVDNLSDYDVIFIGSPVWWSDYPMIMYTFLENNAESLANKTLIPFSTHAGSGLAGFDGILKNQFENANILQGLAIRGEDAQNNQDDVLNTVKEWLSGLNY